MVDADELFARILSLPSGPAIPWFLDVDGTLLAEGDISTLYDWPTYLQNVVATSTDSRVPVTWAPGLVDAINLLIVRGRVEVKWLTSWGIDAPLVAAPAIGLRAGHEVVGMPPESPAWWKLQAVESANLHWAIWTDDALADENPAVANAALIAPDAARGLTPADLYDILDAIEQGGQT